MSNRLADLRTSITSVDDADQLFRDLAVLTKTLRLKDARQELRIAKLQEEHNALTADLRAAIAATKERLVQFVAAHQPLFDEPRTRKSEFGEYGLRTATEVVIEDEEALLEELMERGYEDCFETVRTPVKSAIKRRLVAEETLPHVSLNRGNTVVCKVAPALLRQAEEEAAS
jgi:hypothetical protein